MLFNYFEKFAFFKGKSSRFKHGLLHVVDEFKSSLKEFLQGERWRLILVIFYTALMIAAQFLVAPMLLKGLGCRNVSMKIRHFINEFSVFPQRIFPV